ncbi:MAG TPA: type VI secretion system tube protein Hcp [Xanthobacteraceae bacterium]|jgi:type VI secretion system secreted protein Hcp|nr:type VI secretion system tube protein Hcp [Xanthobacteraceae bacterium]
MPSDYLLVIDGIKGESQDAKHKDAIEIDSFSFGETNTGSFAFGTGGGTGKVNFQDMHFSTRVNKASPNLMIACATGKHINKATLYARKSTGDGGQQEFLTITLEDVLVSSYQTGGHDGNGHSTLPTDQFSLNFAKIELAYKPQEDTGKLGAAITAKYDVRAQK